MTSEGTSELQKTGQVLRNQNGSRVVSAFRDLKTETKVTGAFLVIALIIVGVVVGYEYF